MTEKMNINVFIPKNNNIFVAIVAVLALFSVVLYSFPAAFVFLFNDILGNLLLLLGVIGVGYFDFRWGVGLAAIFVILYQAFSLSKSGSGKAKQQSPSSQSRGLKEGFDGSCKTGCVAPTEATGNCQVSADKKTLICPWDCKYPGSGSGYCSYDTDCASCTPRGTFVNPDNNVLPDMSHGICSDGTTYKIDDAGTNCPGYQNNVLPDMSHGICSDGTTYKIDDAGTNCPSQPSSNGSSSSSSSSGNTSGNTSGNKNNVIPATTGTGSWSPKLQADFANFENTHNPNFQFDMNIIQKQASPEEVEYLIKNNKWPWSDSVKAMYKDAIMRNSTISMDPGVAMDVAQTIYNETAVKQMLSWNTKEGAFLLTGVTVGHTKGLPDNLNNIVRCGLPNGVDGGAVMEKITNVGYDGINGSMTKNYATVPNSELPNLVPGFKFLKGECNPCVALDDPANYSCPFSLNVGDGGEVSTIWQNLWGLVSGGSSSSKKHNKKEFPILNELANELNKASSMLNISGSDSGNIIVEDAVSPPEDLALNDTVESPYLNSNL
jgi:hypothetical protein